MEQRTEKLNTTKKSIDFGYILRQIRKSIYYIVCISIMCGVLVYIVKDKNIHTTYKATMVMVVVPRDNVVNRQLSSAIEMAVTRSVNVLNSSSLREEITEENNGTYLPGQLSAENIPDTNMIRMTAVASTSRDALRLLRAGLNAYPAIAGYMESGYLVRRLSEISADNITVYEPRAFYTGLWVILGLILAGIALVVLKAMLTDKIHSKEQIESLLDIPLIGTIAYVRKKRGNKALSINQDQVDIAYVENIDRIVTSLQEKLDEGQCKTVLATSISENEGKTTIVANLAMNLATRGYRVCLVDGDLRRPALLKFLEKKEEVNVSVSQVLQGEHSIKEAMIPYEEGLELYLQEKGIPEPDKLLEKEVFNEFLSKLKEYYDYIIIDTPPLGIVRDAEIIAKDVDRAVMIFCQDETHSTDINDAVDLMENAGTTVVGGIMNKTRTSILAERSHSYGNYYYYYGYSRKKGKRR